LISKVQGQDAGTVDPDEMCFDLAVRGDEQENIVMHVRRNGEG
jgi:hypothetical protein